ncbi:hypothetical protein RCL_jg5999.t1 [Rhizophagus clarus]|uniref:Uncharacterized protein n=1 Tax=Rhizophagus clarus TaxID=94130 RepID=A0A8H3QWK4_9GLOM|nr:hypothetical protein RCL_jg5999.t1 [Rhizophagus clarus]
MTVHFNNYRITGSLCNYNINWLARNKILAKIPTIRLPPPDKLVSITHHEDNHHIKIRQEEHYNVSQNPNKYKSKNMKRHIFKSPNPRQRTTSTSYVTETNACALKFRAKLFRDW